MLESRDKLLNNNTLFHELFKNCSVSIDVVQYL